MPILNKPSIGRETSTIEDVLKAMEQYETEKFWTYDNVIAYFHSLGDNERTFDNVLKIINHPKFQDRLNYLITNESSSPRSEIPLAIFSALASPKENDPNNYVRLLNTKPFVDCAYKNQDNFYYNFLSTANNNAPRTIGGKPKNSVKNFWEDTRKFRAGPHVSVINKTALNEDSHAMILTPRDSDSPFTIYFNDRSINVNQYIEKNTDNKKRLKTIFNTLRGIEDQITHNRTSDYTLKRLLIGEINSLKDSTKAESRFSKHYRKVMDNFYRWLSKGNFVTPNEIGQEVPTSPQPS